MQIGVAIDARLVKRGGEASDSKCLSGGCTRSEMTAKSKREESMPLYQELKCFTK